MTEGTVSTLKHLPKIDELLFNRAITHGDWDAHAGMTQALLATFFQHNKDFTRYTPSQVEAIHMIFHKLGRIHAGDPHFKDHWDDIAGYAQLVAQRCK